jgi:hypothetical protein
MGKFLASEKPYQVEFKTSSNSISEKARSKDGIYKDHPYPFCLPRECADENLFPEIREPMLIYFACKQIKWHDGQDGNPSNHMCDSQVCCANFLFPFFNKPDALAALLRPVFPTLDHMLPIEDRLYVAFEWIGKANYLHEIKSTNRVRTRGANFTSADAAVKFQHTDGRKQIVLIEWKYTESYSTVNLEIAHSGRSRTEIYEHLFKKDDCPFDKRVLPGYSSLFYEPFYQLMRQQFLANEMEKARELEADVVSLMHISPEHNHDFKRVTSPELVTLGNSPTDVWKKLVRIPDRFSGQTSERLIGKFDVSSHPEMANWYAYITSRYHWVIEQ